MRVIQALHWLRGALADTGDQRRILRRLRAILDDKDQGPAIAADLADGLPTLPSWMQDIVRQLLTDHDGGGGAAAAADDGDGDARRVQQRRHDSRGAIA